MDPKKARLNEANIVENTLIYQGAEARVYKLKVISDTSKGSHDWIIRKERLAKTWRHPTLDASLRKSRLKQEILCLTKAKQAGIIVPNLISIDKDQFYLHMEFIEGVTLKVAIEKWNAELSMCILVLFVS